jgi:hypothetical protein
VNDYAFPLIADMEYKWPESIPRDLVLVATVDAICVRVRSFIPTSLPLQESLASSPGDFIPCLKFMLREMEECHYQPTNNDKGSDSGFLPKLFPIVPSPSMNWRFVSLNAEILASFFASVNPPRRPDDYPAVFFQVFDFNHLRIRK